MGELPRAGAGSGRTSPPGRQCSDAPESRWSWRLRRPCDFSPSLKLSPRKKFTSKTRQLLQRSFLHVHI